MWTNNFFEDDERFDYFRFPIGELKTLPKQFDPDTPEGVLRLFNPLLDYIEDMLKQKYNIMIHCIAGKHRAGTSMCAWLMYKEGMTMK